METKTSDIQVAAYLLSQGYPLVRIEGDSKRKIFAFGQCSQDVVLAYYQGEDQTSARQLFNAYRDLKSLIFRAPMAN